MLPLSWFNQKKSVRISSAIPHSSFLTPHSQLLTPNSRMDWLRQSIFKTAMNASDGTATLPTWRMRFLPSFCFSSSFFLRLMSPP